MVTYILFISSFLFCIKFSNFFTFFYFSILILVISGFLEETLKVIIQLMQESKYNQIRSIFFATFEKRNYFPKTKDLYELWENHIVKECKCYIRLDHWQVFREKANTTFCCKVLEKIFLLRLFFSSILFEYAVEEHKEQTRLLVSGQSPECSDCLLRFMEQQ